MTITWQQLRTKVGAIAKERNEYAGLPLPCEEAALVLAPSHPLYTRYHGFQFNKEEKEPEGPSNLLMVNSWYCHKTRRNIIILKEGADGRVELGVEHNGHPVRRVGGILKCMGIAMQMDLMAERKALGTLSGLIKEHLYQAYMMTGAFIETSKRSGVTYIFRRLAPTLAFRQRTDRGREEMYFLAALCLHPLAYYEALPMSCMVPTDDVIAHLVMMRADEHLFWKRSNQHDYYSPGAQL